MLLDYSAIKLWLELRNHNLIGGGKTPTIIEMGEPYWKGDVPTERVHHIIDEFHQETQAQTLHAELKSLRQLSQTREGEIEDIARDIGRQIASLFVRTVSDCKHHRSIDLQGDENALHFDLNLPVDFECQFDVVTNWGTSASVFNQQQFFQTCHKATKPGGLMIHRLPHHSFNAAGLYHYQPSIIMELCVSNNYRPLSLITVNHSSQPPKMQPLDHNDLANTAPDDQPIEFLAVLRKGPQQQSFVPPQPSQLSRLDERAIN